MSPWYSVSHSQSSFISVFPLSLSSTYKQFSSSLWLPVDCPTKSDATLVGSLAGIREQCKSCLKVNCLCHRVATIVSEDNRWSFQCAWYVSIWGQVLHETRWSYRVHMPRDHGSRLLLPVSQDAFQQPPLGNCYSIPSESLHPTQHLKVGLYRNRSHNIQRCISGNCTLESCVPRIILNWRVFPLIAWILCRS